MTDADPTPPPQRTDPTPDALQQRVQRRYDAFADARTAYIDALLELVAFQTRLVLSGAASLVVHHPVFDHDGARMHLVRVLGDTGDVLAGVDGDDEASVLAAEEVADDIDAVLDQLASYGFTPDRGGVIPLPAPGDTGDEPPGTITGCRDHVA
jgi:hypothetical protein